MGWIVAVLAVLFLGLAALAWAVYAVEKRYGRLPMSRARGKTIALPKPRDMELTGPLVAVTIDEKAALEGLREALRRIPEVQPRPIPLEPVGEDWDGTIRPVNELFSTCPTCGRPLTGSADPPASPPASGTTSGTITLNQIRVSPDWQEPPQPTAPAPNK
jgi:hypothetical protein